MSQQITLPAEEEFRQLLVGSLPKVVARKAVPHLLGGIVAPQTLANADASGTGPAGTFRVGNSIVYRTDALVDWVIARFGVAEVITNTTHLIK